MSRIVVSPLTRILFLLGLVVTNGMLFQAQKANAIPEFIGVCDFCWDMEGKLAYCCALECTGGPECNCNGGRDCAVAEQ